MDYVAGYVASYGAGYVTDCMAGYVASYEAENAMLMFPYDPRFSGI